MVKIDDVARLANVSPATVSRVLNGTAMVKSETRKRVLDAIHETGFKPNEIARSLYKKSSRIIGYVVPSILNIFQNEVGRAIEAEAFLHGYKVILCNTDGSPEKESSYIHMLGSMNADGIIITSGSENLKSEISGCSMPVVMLDRQVGVPFSAVMVQSDQYKGGFLAAEHLIQCGCRHIVHMRVPQKYVSGIQRYHGFLDACKKYGVEPRYIDSNYDYESGISSARELLRQFPDTDGILAASDMSALSLFKVLCEQGKHVPDDVMIVGFDDIRLSSLMTPEMTTIAQPMDAMGRLAVNILIDLVTKKGIINKDNILPVALKIRQTTKKKNHERVLSEKI